MKTHRICTICGEEKTIDQFAGYSKYYDRCACCYIELAKQDKIKKAHEAQRRIKAYRDGEKPRPTIKPANKNSGCRRLIEDFQARQQLKEDFDYL